MEEAQVRSRAGETTGGRRANGVAVGLDKPRFPARFAVAAPSRGPTRVTGDPCPGRRDPMHRLTNSQQ